MLTQSSSAHQTNLFGTDLLLQLDPNDPLLKLSSAIPWHHFEEVFAIHYKEKVGVPSKLIRLMVGLDEEMVLEYNRNQEKEDEHRDQLRLGM